MIEKTLASSGARTQDQQASSQPTELLGLDKNDKESYFTNDIFSRNFSLKKF